MENSPRYLPQAQRPSTLNRCVGTLKNGYVRNIPLPRVLQPQVQSASLVTSSTSQVTADPHDTCYSQVPCVPMWGNLARFLAGLGRSNLTFSPVWLI